MFKLFLRCSSYTPKRLSVNSWLCQLYKSISNPGCWQRIGKSQLQHVKDMQSPHKLIVGWSNAKWNLHFFHWSYRRDTHLQPGYVLPEMQSHQYLTWWHSWAVWATFDLLNSLNVRPSKNTGLLHPSNWHLPAALAHNIRNVSSEGSGPRLDLRAINLLHLFSGILLYIPIPGSISNKCVG